MLQIASIFTVVSEVIVFVEDLLGVYKAASAPLTVDSVGQTAITAVTTAQAALALTENVVTLSAHELSNISTALADVEQFAKVLANSGTQDVLTLLTKACTTVVAMIPAGALHDKLAAVFAAVQITNAAYQTQVAGKPIPVAVATSAAA